MPSSETKTKDGDKILLRCGHHAASDPVTVFPVNAIRYWCEECRTLERKK